jgi:hypothetical protein
LEFLVVVFALGFALGYATREAEVSYAQPSLQSRLTGAGERNFSIIIVVHARWGRRIAANIAKLPELLPKP